MNIKKETFQFLKDLKKNNNREWFNDNKDKYLFANENFLHFTQSIIYEVAKFDKSVADLDAKDTVFRIYRDTRFSKDKTPYKPYFASVLMGRNTGSNAAGYYLHLEPGNSMLVGGVHAAEPKTLNLIRQEINANGKEFLKIINAKTFKDNFKLEGEKLVNVPKGFDKENPMSEYLKYKELMIIHSAEDKYLLSENAVSYCAKIFKAMLPFNSFLNSNLI